MADVIGAIDGVPPSPPRWVASPAAETLHELLQRAWSAERNVLASTTIAQLVRHGPGPASSPTDVDNFDRTH